MANQKKGTHVNVSMKKPVWTKAKRLQKEMKLATISDAIDFVFNQVRQHKVG